MHCQSCNADLGAAEARVGFICAEVMGDEYIESYRFCEGCGLYMTINLRDPFHGEISERGGGQLSKEKGGRLRPDSLMPRPIGRKMPVRRPSKNAGH